MEVNMKKIYVLLMHTNTIPSKLIKIFTRSEYSHIGISLDRSCNNIYSFGRKTLRAIWNAGFTVDKKEGEFFKVFNKTKCKIYEVEVTEKQYREVEKILNDMSSNSKIYKYDFFCLIPRFFGIPITLKNRYVCSYFVAQVLERTGIHNFDKNTCLVIPKDFEHIEEFQEIYQGNYTLYK